MAEPQQRSALSWEAQLASVALAGVRPLVADALTINATTEDTYTVTHEATKRVVLLTTATGDTDVRVALNETADGDSFPVLPLVYFVLEAKVDEVVHLYNAAGSSRTIYILEIR